MSDRTVHHHPALGTVTYAPIAVWKASSSAPLGDTDEDGVVLTVLDDSELPAGRLDEVAATPARLDPQVLHDIVAEDSLELYNSTWRQDDDERLDRDGFCAKIRPTLRRRRRRPPHPVLR
ncbi:hypothetical protein ACFO1B_33405 [Dactylosporangium siamense]|uniref:Uncharacterized protein n=1 Tax=Dactylosporangium siamense TaxID=685454 RepID=A0A919PF95_9ACTN|nr:hypothetical protein [Dactylosporangium siamense]GIG42499.1 hypothetical protein Dsi01nite_005400 [Dactylosporangium siamense]